MHDDWFLVELVSGVPVVRAPEEIDTSNAPELHSALLEAATAANGARALVADLTRTRFCDSAGVHALMVAHKRALAEGGELLLVISSAAVLRIFAITGIDRVIPNFPNLHDALAHTSPNGSGDRQRPDDGLDGGARRTAGAARHDSSGSSPQKSRCSRWPGPGR